MMQVSEKTSLTEAHEVYSFSVSQAFVDIHLDRRLISRVEPCGGSQRRATGREQHRGRSRYRNWFVAIIFSCSFA
jgi:hypothetical protein